MNQSELNFIQRQIGYSFKNKDLLIQAFTRSSYANENGGGDNEILEFIGDKVLDLVVVQMLCGEYGYYAYECEDYERGDPKEYYCELSEGSLTKMKSRLVQKKTLAARIGTLGFADYLYMGNSDVMGNASEQDSVREDLFEAIIGAVALDCDYDFKVLREIVDVMLDPDSILRSDEPDNYIGIIQDWSLSSQGSLPDYYVDESIRVSYPISEKTIIRSGGRSLSGYTCLLRLPGIDRLFVGSYNSKKAARMKAAEAAYEYLCDNKLLLTIKDELDDPNYEDSISQLEILARRGYFTVPTYEYSESHDNNGAPIWTCKCHIKEKSYFTKGSSSSKKTAKKDAAYEMLCYVLKE